MPHDVYCYEGELPPDMEMKVSLDRIDDLMRKGWQLAISRAVAELRSMDLHDAVAKINALKFDDR